MGVKELIKSVPVVRSFSYARFLYPFYRNQHRDMGKYQFYLKATPKIHVTGAAPKTEQICDLIKHVRINPVDNRSFFYSIDPFTAVRPRKQLLDNMSIDYSWAVNGSFKDLNEINGEYSSIIDALKSYVDRASSEDTNGIHKDNLAEIRRIFTERAVTLHEGLQRVLFINQWLWQSGHKNNGLGHLDIILGDLYDGDKDKTKEYIKGFFLVLHENCWFKSNMLLGDTGQIITIGGLSEDGKYQYNELTKIFIEAASEVKLPDPKLILRASSSMPDHLLGLAVSCIATGIGSPLVCNDDRIIPSLIQYGYDEKDVYNYATSACWEPFIIGNSCEHNNQWTINFCAPLISLINSSDFETINSFDKLLERYFENLRAYIDNALNEIDLREFEPDPLLTLFDPKALASHKDITQGGARYINTGLTSVGLSTAVDSLLAIKELVFNGHDYSLSDLNSKRRNNFENEDELLNMIRSISSFGSDNEEVLSLVNGIMRHTSKVLEKHKNSLGGKYKFGLSSPNYIIDSVDTEATFDGRKNGEPFAVNISAHNGVPPTELICFASGIDYNGNRINGNVVDFILSPTMISYNKDKMIMLIKGAIAQGIYQFQINVVDSKTLIEAKKHPELFPNLVVRVWGFSAYFTDLPEEYQDVLIRRTIEAEKLV